MPCYGKTKRVLKDCEVCQRTEWKSDKKENEGEDAGGRANFLIGVRILWNFAGKGDVLIRLGKN